MRAVREIKTTNSEEAISAPRQHKKKKKRHRESCRRNVGESKDVPKTKIIKNKTKERLEGMTWTGYLMKYLLAPNPPPLEIKRRRGILDQPHIDINIESELHVSDISSYSSQAFHSVNSHPLPRVVGKGLSRFLGGGSQSHFVCCNRSELPKAVEQREFVNSFLKSFNSQCSEDSNFIKNERKNFRRSAGLFHYPTKS